MTSPPQLDSADRLGVEAPEHGNAASLHVAGDDRAAAVADVAADDAADRDGLAGPSPEVEALRASRNWFRWAHGQGPMLLWIVALHVLAAVGLVLFPWPGWPVLAISYALVWLGGIGTTVAYHRALAHRSVKLNPVVEFVLVGFAVANGSGAPAGWAATHRRHHAYADTPLDVSSPRYGGFWWSHLRWLWQTPQSSLTRWAPDLDGRGYAFWTRWQPLLVIVSLCAGLPFGMAAFFWVGAIRLVYSLHGQCLINSAAHLGNPGARRGDSSKDLPWLAPFHSFQGETWHASHHASPNSARIGRTWWQIDVGWWVILLLERLGLASRVRRRRRA